MTHYSRDRYENDARRAVELMTKLQTHFPGYPRMIIVMACTRIIAAMLGPASDDSRETYLRDTPELLRSMWRAMDAEIPRQAAETPRHDA